MADTIENLQKKRRGLDHHVQTMKTTVAPMTKDNTTFAILADKKRSLDALIIKLDEVYEGMTMLCDDATYALIKKEIETSINLRGEVSGMICNLCAEMNANAPPPPPPTQRAAEVKLPKLDPPKFSGNIWDWPSFRDLFQASLKTSSGSIPGSQKFLFLQQALKDGSAYDVVKNIPPTDSSFMTAWDLLKERYDDTWEIVLAYVDKFMKLPVAKEENGNSLRKIVDLSREYMRGLEHLSQPVAEWDVWFIKIVLDKIDNETRREWEQSRKDSSVPKFTDMLKILDKRSKMLLAIGEPSNKGKSSFSHTPKPSLPKSTKGLSAHHASPMKCPDCKKEHSLYKCPTFLSKDIAGRKSVIKDNALCFNCLKSGHSVSQCSSSCCRKCQGKHHTLIHADNVNEQSSIASHSSTTATTGGEQVLLGTARILLRDHTGRLRECRALLDGGSQGSFITENCITRLGLPRQQSSLSVLGLAKKKVATVRGCVEVQVKSYLDPEFTCHVKAYILMSATKNLPDFTFHKPDYSHIESLTLADPSYNVTSAIDVIIGADVLNFFMLEGLRKHPAGGPMAQQTVFGWVLSGEIQASNRKPSTIVCNHSSLEELVERFWTAEDVQESSSSIMSTEEAAAESHFLSTYSRDVDRRFCVRLPLKSTATKLGSSRAMAIQRLRGQERRLVTTPGRYDEYREFMKEYVSLGHMRLVNASHIHIPTSYYLPHHSVIKGSSLTTKLRVVFDASAKSSSGLSLNDVLMVGPKTQDDLMSILLRFRTHPVAMVADVAKMYRQINVHDDDLPLQRIVWRNSPEEPIQDYELITVTYGTASAPFAATRCLKQLAILEMHQFPKACEVVIHDFYVDDLVSGAASTEEAIQLAREVSSLLSSAKFNLRKWVSNDLQLLASLPDGHASQDAFFIQDESSVATLGVKWNPVADTFTAASHVQPPTTITKRSILSQVAKLYDPMGWIAPVVIRAKILLQNLWELKLDWDQDLEAVDALEEGRKQLQSHLCREWLSFQQQIQLLGQVQVPRFVLSSASPIKLELHVFSDASEKAYGAAVFIRSVCSSSIQVHLMAAKTKVAPLKTQSLPRLELCGAVLGVKLLKIVKDSLPSFSPQLFGWTDSTIVLAWLSSPPGRWSTFVANRVSKVQSFLPRDRWHHVRSEENPADCCSRGILPEELLHHHLWWNGPAWLQDQDFHVNNVSTVTTTLEERKSIAVHTAIIATTTLWEISERYSSWSRLVRITAYLKRFIHNCFNKERRRVGPLTIEELQTSEHIWLKQHQQQFFMDDLTELSKKKEDQRLPRSSSLVRLAPFVDAHGLLRVGGRLQAAQIPSDKKFPIILNSKGKIIDLLVRSEHLRLLHAGPQLLLASLASRFWILGGRNKVRYVCSKCVTCTRHKGEVMAQQMGNLPSPRVNPGRAFLHCGVDFAGPFELRTMKVRKAKRYKAYVSLFVCFSTRAIHLEVVSELTTKAFIAALKRFVSRRGLPLEIRSDCGSNFLGTKREIEELSRFLMSEESSQAVSSALSSHGVKWSLNPPSAPHFGGLWEAGVKSFKYHFKRILGNDAYTFEEMTTAITQIEACLNSRPLCPMSSDPSDLEVLTPGHFLIGQSLTALPDPDVTSLKTGTLDRWQKIQQVVQHFWHRWSSEYLTRLQQRPKWWTAKPNLAEGSLVLIKDDRLPPLQWKLGRVLQLFPGKDGLVRAARIQTDKGELDRPVVKLCILPFDNSSTEA